MADTALFVWEGTDRQGRKTKGEISSTNQQIARAELRRQGINPSKVNKKAQSRFSFGGGVNAQDMSLFTRQMATMMRAGVPLVQSFDIVSDGADKPSLKALIRDIRTDVAAGNSFASAIRKHPKQFDDLFCNLVESGEQSGALETMLDRIAGYKEKAESLKGKVKKAMFYPIAVLVIAFVVSAILLIKVVPQFQVIFQSFGAELPAFTQMVINFSNIAQKYWFPFLVLLMIIGAATGAAYTRSPKMREAVDRMSLKIPVIGEILDKSAVARFARTLSTTFAAGVPLVDALESVAGATGNIVYANATRRVRDDVASGQQLNFAMRNTGVFPNMVIQMTSIGEESGSLDTMLDKAASYFEEQVDNAVDALTSLLEPIIMAVLGVVIGGLIIAMYLPIFQLGQVVGQ